MPICAEKLRHLAERERIEAMTPARDLTPEDAQTVLRREGWTVVRANVVGGSRKHWFVNGVGKDVTDEQLIERAERILQRKAAA